MSRTLRQRREAPRPSSAGGVLRRAPRTRTEDGGAPSHGLGDVSVAPPEAQSAMGSASSSPLEGPVRHRLERGFGTSLADVRVATDERAAEAADALEARAFTVGPSIWFNRGEYQPHSGEGWRLLAHEVAHSLQQRGGPGAPQAKLEVGRSDDPAEAAADRAADAVASGGRAAVSPGGAGVVRRQKKRTCTAGPLSASNVSAVKCDDGAEYDATVFSRDETKSPVKVSGLPGIDSQDVWVDITVCKGRDEVTITPSVNLTQAAQDVVNNLLSGQSAFGGVTLSPTLTITWNNPKGFFSASGGPTIDARSGKVTGGSAQVCYDNGKVKVCIGLSGTTDPQSIQGTGSVSGSSRPPAKDCTTTRKVPDAYCQPVTYTKEVKPIEPDDLQVYVFFKYKEAGEPIAPTPVIQRKDAAVSGKSLDDLAKDGYRAVAVSGYTSPEGPRKQKTKAFVGNDQLSLDRAKAAVDWLKNQAGGGLGEPASVNPESELYSPPPVKGVEVEGDPLTKAAVTGFETTPDPLKGRSDPKLEKKKPSEQRGELYPLLRRAVIQLHKEGKKGEPRKRQPGDAGPCPDDVKKAVLIKK